MRGTLLFKLLHPVHDEGEGFRAEGLLNLLVF